jgi:integrase
MEHEKRSGAYVDPAAGRVTVGTYAAAWAARQPHRPSTVEGVEVILRVHIFPAFEHRPVAQVRSSEVQAWVTGLAQELAPSTVATVFGKLAGIFASAVDDGLIARTPCKGVRLPRKDGGEVVPMDPAEVRAMVDATPPRYRALLVLLAGTGLRPGEALGLTTDRVDFLRRSIRVDRQLLTVSGAEPAFGPPKTAASVRTVPVPQSVLDALADHLHHYPAAPGALIFTDSKGDPIRRNALGHVWRRARAAANAKTIVVRDFTPHDLRHYAASVLIASGLSVKAVQRHLGHASAVTTLDTYAHLWPDAEDSTRAALEAGIGRVVSRSCQAEAREA